MLSQIVTVILINDGVEWIFFLFFLNKITSPASDHGFTFIPPNAAFSSKVSVAITYDITCKVV